jgi:nitroreductase
MTLSELYVGCRTYRRFTQERIPDNVLRACLENARISSTGANAQTLRFICVKSPEMTAKMQPLVKWAAALPPEIGTPKPGEQPTAFIVIVKKAGSGAFADVDVGIAAHAIVTTAWESGVGSCMMGAINRPGIAALLGVDEADTVHLAIALGYPAHKSTIVPVPESGLLKYYVDEKRDYYVPKKTFDELVKIV